MRYDFVSAVFVLYFNDHRNIRTTTLTRKRQTTFLPGQFSGAINRETYGRTSSSHRSSLYSYVTPVRVSARVWVGCFVSAQ